jgi:hypothetical protein
MLTLATLGMLSYGTYSLAWAVVDIVRGAHLEAWAEAGLIIFGLLLVLSAAFVRVGLPGGLAAAIGSMLGLQALAVHNAVHLGDGLPPQIARGAVALVLIGLAWSGSRE